MSRAAATNNTTDTEITAATSNWLLAIRFFTFNPSELIAVDKLLPFSKFQKPWYY